MVTTTPIQPVVKRAGQGALNNIVPFFRNSMAITRNLGEDLLMRPADMKAQALIVSTFALVVSRILVAFNSARSEKQEDQKLPRIKEFFRTLMREVLGWTGSYAVLRTIETGLKVGFRWGLGGERPNNLEKIGFAKFIEDFGKQLDGLFHGRSLEPVRQSSWEALEASFEPVFHNYEKAPLHGPIQEMVKFFRPGLKGEALRQTVRGTMETAYKWGPLGIASAVSIVLSGFVLEWFTLHKSKPIIDYWAEKLHLLPKITPPKWPPIPLQYVALPPGLSGQMPYYNWNMNMAWPVFGLPIPAQGKQQAVQTQPAPPAFQAQTPTRLRQSGSLNDFVARVEQSREQRLKNQTAANVFQNPEGAFMG